MYIWIRLQSTCVSASWVCLSLVFELTWRADGRVDGPPPFFLNGPRISIRRSVRPSVGRSVVRLAFFVCKKVCPSVVWSARDAFFFGRGIQQIWQISLSFFQPTNLDLMANSHVPLQSDVIFQPAGSLGDRQPGIFRCDELANTELPSFGSSLTNNWSSYCLMLWNLKFYCSLSVSSFFYSFFRYILRSNQCWVTWNHSCSQ